MSIFDLRQLIIEEYGKYVQSFFSIADERVQEFIKEEVLIKRALWPDALLQINPPYEMPVTVEDLVSGGKLHPLCSEIFRLGGEESLRLFRQQQEAIEKALNRKHFVVTSGTGSGKTLTYFIPIFDSVVRNNPQHHKVRAIVGYPKNLEWENQL
jgi:ATP-dependent helicase YprA (DUF1998 family)